MLHFLSTHTAQIERVAVRLTILIMMLTELARVVHHAVHDLICVPLGWK